MLYMYGMVTALCEITLPANKLVLTSARLFDHACLYCIAKSPPLS